jgi:hypothetical protein
MKNKMEEEKVCSYCGVALSNHSKCKRCKVLLHKKNKEYKCRCGKQHGLIGKKGYCQECWEEEIKTKT